MQPVEEGVSVLVMKEYKSFNLDWDGLMAGRSLVCKSNRFQSNVDREGLTSHMDEERGPGYYYVHHSLL